MSQRPLYDHIYAVVREIPAGRVATYGQVAAIVGRGTPRTVGYAMHALPSGHDVPWQRVINRQGRTSPRADGDAVDQREILRSEGVVFRSDQSIDLTCFGWSGPDWDWLEANDCHAVPQPWLK